jgi:hypothetical protein
LKAPRVPAVVWMLPMTCLAAALAFAASDSAAKSRADPLNAVVVAKVWACGGLPVSAGGRPGCRLMRHVTVSAFGRGHRLGGN